MTRTPLTTLTLTAEMTTQDRVRAVARHLDTDPMWVLLTTWGMRTRRGVEEPAVFLEFLPAEDVVADIRETDGAWHDRTRGLWSVPDTALSELFARILPGYAYAVLTDSGEIYENQDFRPESRYSPKVFERLDASVLVHRSEAVIALRTAGLSVDLTEPVCVHDGDGFVPLPEYAGFTRLPFLLIRCRDALGLTACAVWSPFAGVVMDVAQVPSLCADRMVSTFTQGLLALRNPPILTEDPEAAERGGLADAMISAFGPALDRISDKLFWHRIGLVPSCWAGFSVPARKDPAQQRLWADAGTYAWVSRGFPHFYAALNVATGGLEVDRPVMIAEKVIRRDVLTDTGKTNTLLHELAHHVHWESEPYGTRDPHHGFWFHVALIALMIAVHGRTASVWAYASVSMERYAEDADADDPLGCPDHAHLVFAAMFVADVVLSGADIVNGAVDATGIVRETAGLRADIGPDGLRELTTPEACRISVLASPWDEDDESIQDEFVLRRKG